MIAVQVLVDLLLALTVLFLAGRLLFDRNLYTSAVLFVVHGLVMSIVWARLAAPDVALAEAAVGAGLTGALILRAAGQIRTPGRLVPLRLLPLVTVILLAAALAGSLLLLLLGLGSGETGLVGEVSEGLSALDLEQPVTAVLLLFRGYDTWLELAVLLIAVLALLGARPAASLATRRNPPASDPLLIAFARLLLPLALVVAGYLVLQGTRHPGGAFQGGAVMAALVTLAYLAGMPLFARLRSAWGPLLIVAAFTLPILLTLPRLLAGQALFSYPEGVAGNWMLVIELTLAVSVAAILTALITGSEPPER